MKSQSIDALVQQLCELRVLEPDAEAEACGAAFEQFVRDRMDEWHAALEAHDSLGADSLQREVFVTRSAKELADRVRAQPVGPRTIELARAYRGATGYDYADKQGVEAVQALRAQWEPAFHRSQRWQRATALFCQSWPVPWVVLACRAIVRETRGVALEKPSPIAPWIALWSRGVWATPYGEGAVGVWVPSADLGAEGVCSALEENLVDDWIVTEVMALGFMPPRSMRGPGCHGVGFFGGGQTDNLDPSPALWLTSPMPIGPPPNMPMPVPNLPVPVMRPPTPNLPTPPIMSTNIPLAPKPPPPTPPPTPQWPPVAQKPATDESKEPVAQEPASDSVLDRLRRWWKK